VHRPASCVELAWGQTLDLLSGKRPAAFTDLRCKPARLFGQRRREVALGTRADALGLFAALATRYKGGNRLMGD